MESLRNLLSLNHPHKFVNSCFRRVSYLLNKCDIIALDCLKISFSKFKISILKPAYIDFYMALPNCFEYSWREYDGIIDVRKLLCN